jgi:hypothetical protein
VRPGLLERWYDDDDELDMDDWQVDEIPKVDEAVHVARVLLGAADPAALAVFDRLHDGGWALRPPHWSGERLRAFSEALGRIPEPGEPATGYWALGDDTVTELTPKLPWSSRYVDSPMATRRESILAEWMTARNLYLFLAQALAAGNDVVVD